MNEQTEFRVFVVGWEPSLIASLLIPIQRNTGIRFVAGLVGDAARLDAVRRKFPEINVVSLSQLRQARLPVPDYELLASLEDTGVPTIRCMVQGDRVLRNRTETESLGYASLLARNLQAFLNKDRPDLVLGSFDSVHAGLSLAVAKSMDIPWVAMAFTAIPNDLTGFCKGVTPNSLVPLAQSNSEELRVRAKTIIDSVRQKRHQVLAYRPPASLRERAARITEYTRNFARRIARPKDLGVDRYTYPSATERMRDIVRRSINRLRLPASQMISEPPDSRFLFFPLQMTPESSIDTWAPYFQNQLALVAQLALALPADIDCVVKLHFSDADNYTRGQLNQLSRLPRVRIAQPNVASHPFIREADIVAGIQGTACLEAALFGKPVLLFGDSPYQYFPRSERAKRPDEVHEQVSRMLRLSPPGDDEIAEAFARYMARYMPGRINDWTRTIDEDEMGRLSACFAALREYLQVPENKDGWYRSAAKEF